MNENCIEALFMKSRQSFYYDMAYDSQSDMFTSLEMFSSCDANNPTSPTSIHQVNCTGTPIYSSLNQVAPPSVYNTNLASIITSKSTSDCITSKQDKTTKALDLNRTSVKLCGVGTSNNSCLDDVDNRTDSTNVNLHEQIYRDQYTLRRSGLREPPIVVITPASALDSESEMDTRDPNAHNENGEFIDGGCLNDGIDSCSLSSACSEDRSEDDIPTDDDPSESDSAQQPDEKIRKTSTSNWKKIRRVIHWSPFVQNFKRKYPWVQLAGHQGSFKAGEDGNILKKTSEKEKDCLIKLMKDILRPYVPEYKREVQNNGENYIEMQDLLQEFENPCIMDCKMGVRTYLEEEIAKAKSKPRKDLYQKMVDIDPSEPTESEHIAKAITKPRYMQWRERLSSSATLGFRIEGIKNGDSKPNKDFKKTKTIEDVAKVFTEYIENDAQLRMKYLRRLKAIRATLEASCFFRTHELIGSSLLFVHDSNGAASIWMIDFGKTVPLPDDVAIDHRSEWKEGNHEDGYLWGLDKMIEVWTLK